MQPVRGWTCSSVQSTKVVAGRRPRSDPKGDRSDGDRGPLHPEWNGVVGKDRSAAATPGVRQGRLAHPGTTAERDAGAGDHQAIGVQHLPGMPLKNEREDLAAKV